MSLVWLVSVAFGHAGAPVEAVDILLPEGDGVYVEGSIGLLREMEDGFRLICHEQITTPEAVLLPRYAVNDADVLLGWMTDPAQARDATETMYRSEGGCSWDAVGGLTGQVVVGAAFDTDDVAAVATDAGLGRSTDGGASFTSTTAVSGLTSLKRGGEGWFWAASAGEALEVHWSNDAGSTWQRAEVPAVADPPEDEVASVRLMHAEGGEAWVLVDYVSVDVLLHTDGVAFTERHRIEGYFSDVDVDADGNTWVAVSGTRFERAEPGGTFSRASAPPGLGVAVRGPDTRVTGRFEITNQAMYADDGDGFAPVFTFYDIAGPLSCPEEPGSEVCPQAWTVLKANLGIDAQVGDTALPLDPEDPPRDCGCRQGGGGWAWLLLPLLAIRRSSAR